MDDQWPVIRVRGPGATSRQRRLVLRAWQRHWARYRADGSPALAGCGDVEVRVLSATVTP